VDIFDAKASDVWFNPSCGRDAEKAGTYNEKTDLFSFRASGIDEPVGSSRYPQ
jgi:hypothetical protein